MATISIVDYMKEEFGLGIQNIRVRAYPVDLSGDVILTPSAETFTDTDGRFAFTALDTSSSPAGYFHIEMKNQSTGQVRWHHGDIQFQVGGMVGKDGAAPIQDGSITSAKIASFGVGSGQLAASAVTEQKLANDAVTDAKLGNRTIDDSQTPTNSGTLTALLSSLANRIKSVQGTTSWTSTVPTSLSNLDTRMSALEEESSGAGDPITISDTYSTFSNSTFVSAGISMLASVIKRMLGTSNWYDAPAATIASLHSRVTALENSGGGGSGGGGGGGTGALEYRYAEKRTGQSVGTSIIYPVSISLSSGTWIVTGTASLQVVGQDNLELSLTSGGTEGELRTNAQDTNSFSLASVVVTDEVVVSGSKTVQLKVYPVQGVSGYCHSASIYAIRVA